MLPDKFTISDLRQRYQRGDVSPQDVMRQVLTRIARDSDNPVWIHVLTEAELSPYLQALQQKDFASHPLWGVPFAIKDNIDLAGIATTAACPAYSYVPNKHAFVVQKLIDAGAIPVGKTNLDQFATGLVGTRSPYGVVRNAFRPEFISGGSSSGSAVAVACGHVAFSLGTDTAGSGRVPASLNQLVGVKPSKGLLGTTGVVPACRSLDCVSLFAHNLDDATLLLQTAQAYDDADIFSRVFALDEHVPSHVVIGVPRADQLEFFGNYEARQLFGNTIASLHAQACKVVEIDFLLFMQAARLLYQGPWVAERWLVVRDMIEHQPDAMLQVTRSIIASARNFSAADAFAAQYQLAALRRAIDPVLASVTAIITPTIGSPFTRDEVSESPVQRNTDLGYYTNFMNLLDLAALAVPAPPFANGLPNGVTLFADHGSDLQLLALAKQIFPGEKFI